MIKTVVGQALLLKIKLVNSHEYGSSNWYEYKYKYYIYGAKCVILD